MNRLRITERRFTTLLLHNLQQWSAINIEILVLLLILEYHIHSKGQHYTINKYLFNYRNRRCVTTLCPTCMLSDGMQQWYKNMLLVLFAWFILLLRQLSVSLHYNLGKLQTEWTTKQKLRRVISTITYLIYLVLPFLLFIIGKMYRREKLTDAIFIRRYYTLNPNKALFLQLRNISWKRWH